MEIIFLEQELISHSWRKTSVTRALNWLKPRPLLPYSMFRHKIETETEKKKKVTKISWKKCFSNQLQCSINLTNTMLWQKRNIFCCRSVFTSRYRDFLYHKCWFSHFQMTAYHSKMHCCVTETATEAPGKINGFYSGSYEKSILIKVSTCPLQIFGCKGLILHFAFSSVEASMREIRQMHQTTHKARDFRKSSA